MRIDIIFTILFTLLISGCSEKQDLQPVTETNENINPRFSELNPKAWEGLPMPLVVADFQQSDGIFSSFICDEINRRLSHDLAGSLKELNSIEENARTNVFKICFSSEAGDYSPGILTAIGNYSGQYPELVNEITEASR